MQAISLHCHFKRQASGLLSLYLTLHFYLQMLSVYLHFAIRKEFSIAVSVCATDKMTLNFLIFIFTQTTIKCKIYWNKVASPLPLTAMLFLP